MGNQTELRSISDEALRAEIQRRDTVRREAEERVFRARMRERFGLCEECGANYVGWRIDDEKPILMCGILGHEPGNYGFEAQQILTCERGHESWHPYVRFYDRPMPL